MGLGFRFSVCSVMSCHLPLTLQGGRGERAAADQTGRVRPLPSFPPRLSGTDTPFRPPRPLLVWRSTTWHQRECPGPISPRLLGEPRDHEPCSFQFHVNLQTPPGPGVSGRLGLCHGPHRRDPVGGTAAREAGKRGCASQTRILEVLIKTCIRNRTGRGGDCATHQWGLAQGWTAPWLQGMPAARACSPTAPSACGPQETQHRVEAGQTAPSPGAPAEHGHVTLTRP